MRIFVHFFGHNRRIKREEEGVVCVMDYVNSFEEIKKLAKKKGWNIEKLAKKAGISRSTIYNIKNIDTSKSDISVRTARSIANALGCPVSKFMTLDKEQKLKYEPPKPKQFELKVWGDFTIQPQVGHCCIVTTSYQLPQKELEAQVKRYLFGNPDVDNTTLETVRSYAKTLVKSGKKAEAEKTNQ